MRRGDSIVIAGNDPTRQLRGNATAFGSGQLRRRDCHAALAVSVLCVKRGSGWLLELWGSTGCRGGPRRSVATAASASPPPAPLCPACPADAADGRSLPTRRGCALPPCWPRTAPDAPADVRHGWTGIPAADRCPVTTARRRTARPGHCSRTGPTPATRPPPPLRVPRQLFLPKKRPLFLPVHPLGLAPLLGGISPVAGDVKLQDHGVVHDPVNRRGGGHGVGEDALPL